MSSNTNVVAPKKCPVLSRARKTQRGTDSLQIFYIFLTWDSLQHPLSLKIYAKLADLCSTDAPTNPVTIAQHFLQLLHSKSHNQIYYLWSSCRNMLYYWHAYISVCTHLLSTSPVLLQRFLSLWCVRGVTAHSRNNLIKIEQAKWQLRRSSW